jgi:PAS domain S-box-containing protein
MILAQPTPDEERRIATLRQYDVLDTLPEQALDDLTSLAAAICGAPIAMISLIDERRQWFKSKVGLEMAESARDISFCGHAVHQRDLFIVPDATHDERFADNPLVTGDPRICFYAGAPLVNSADVALGTLCVIDQVPRALTQAQEKALRVLARQVMMYLDLRRQMRELAESEERLRVATENVIVAKTASKRLSLIVEGSDDAIIGKDLNSIITSWNKGAKKIFGYTASEMMGTSIMRLIPDDRRDEETQILAKIGRGENVEHFETLRQTKDGRLIDVSVTASPIRDATGKIIGVSKIARDITESKKAEIALKKSESLFRVLVEQAVDAFFLHDATGRFFEVNRRACESLGYSKVELLNMRVSDVACMNEEEVAGIWTGLQNGSSLTVNDHHRRKDGTRFPVEIRLGSLEVDGQKLYLGLARDITERRLAEERIAEQAAFLDKARDAILARDLEGKILFWNSGAERIYGWTRQEVTGQNIGDLLYTDPKKF